MTKIALVYKPVELKGASKIDKERGLEVDYKLLLDENGESTGLILCSFCENFHKQKYGRPWFRASVKGSNSIKKQLCDKHAERHHFKSGKKTKKRKRSDDDENQPRLNFQSKKAITEGGIKQIQDSVIKFICSAGLPLKENGQNFTFFFPRFFFDFHKDCK